MAGWWGTVTMTRCCWSGGTPLEMIWIRSRSERPVAVVHVSGHLAVVNSAALKMLGIDATTPDPIGGVIVRDPDSADGRRPNGVLEETAARAVWEHTLDLGVMDALRMTTQAAEEYLAVGCHDSLGRWNADPGGHIADSVESA